MKKENYPLTDEFRKYLTSFPVVSVRDYRKLLNLTLLLSHRIRGTCIQDMSTVAITGFAYPNRKSMSCVGISDAVRRKTPGLTPKNLSFSSGVRICLMLFEQSLIKKQKSEVIPRIFLLQIAFAKSLVFLDFMMPANNFCGRQV